MSRDEIFAVKKALAICGAEDFSNDGESGSVSFEGDFAAAVAQVIFADEETRQRFALINQPVRVQRSGGLEIWCNGFCIEGKSVRKIIHEASRRIGYQKSFSIKDILPARTFESSRWLQTA